MAFLPHTMQGVTLGLWDEPLLIRGLRVWAQKVWRLFLTQNFMLIMKSHFLNAEDAAFSQQIALSDFFACFFIQNWEIAILTRDTV